MLIGDFIVYFKLTEYHCWKTNKVQLAIAYNSNGDSSRAAARHVLTADWSEDKTVRNNLCIAVRDTGRF